MPDVDYIPSAWRITFDPGVSPQVLVQYDDWIDQELALVLAAAVGVTDPIDSADVFIRDGKARSFTTSIKVYKTETLDMDARIAAMNSLLTVQAFTKKPLRIQVKGFAGGHYWQFASAFVKSHAPLRVVASGKARWSRQYDIIATGLSYT